MSDNSQNDDKEHTDDERLNNSEDKNIDNDDEDVEIEQDNSIGFQGNPGWADVFRKILNTNKPKKKKTLVLSRAKKLTEVLAKKSETLTKAETNEQSVAVTKKKTEDHKSTNEIKSKLVSLRKKPSILDRGRERILQKIATKGIIQLFNAVEKQQIQINKNLKTAGPLLRKQENVLKNVDKRVFLDMLMGNTKSISVNDTIDSEEIKKDDNDHEEKVWSVLRDDFVMGAKLKDWDKKTNDDEELSSDAEDIDGM